MENIKKIILWTLGTVFIAVAVFGIMWGITSLSTMLKPSNESVEFPDLSKNIQAITNIKNDIKDKVSTDTEKDENGNTNILLVGISGEDYISGNLADTIILTTLNRENNKANMFSIPRDLWVKDPDGNFQKINEFYKIGGGTEEPDIKASGPIIQKVEEVTGQKIHYTAIVSLSGIEKFVDIIGGIETEEGKVNGEQALMYIRDRSKPGGDFDRMARQQKLLMDIFDKIEEEPIIDSENPEEVLGILTTLSGYFDTNIGIAKMITLDEDIRNLDTEDVGLYTITPAQDNLLYSDYTDLNGQEIYTLHPTAGYEDYSEIHDFIANIVTNSKE
ncbi:MAG: LCP family protein [Candidatus Spechtbacterales bacterium]|nr:LCP family protein [Candidatus Spechtbacterales bacterium]